MGKLKVGVWCNLNKNPHEGGGFGYQQRLLRHLSAYVFQNAEIYFVGYNDNDSSVLGKTFYGLKKFQSDKPLFVYTYKLLYHACKILGLNNDKFNCELKHKRYQNSIVKILSSKIDVIYYPEQICPIDFYPYIFTLWDLGYKSSFPFPEFFDKNSFNSRKSFAEKSSDFALGIFCESYFGRDEAMRILGLTISKLFVVPMFPSDIVEEHVFDEPIEILNGKKFIFYPAQYWAHKNHVNLLQAFVDIVQEFKDIKLVFTGSDKGNRSYVNSVTKELLLHDNVIDLGFIPVQQLKWLYKNSIGLVFPSLLGPTNMPLLEAIELGCKVACSNLPGHIEQLGESAIYFDPLDHLNISNSIKNLILEYDSENKILPKSSNMNQVMESIDLAFLKINALRKTWA